PGRACSRADFRRALTHRRILLATGAAGAVCLAAAASAQTTDVVAITGDAAPDGNGTFRNFGKPVLNDAGQLAFSASLDGTTGGGSDNAGIFRGDGLSPLVPIFHKGAPAPNGNGSILGFSAPVLNAAGQAAFAGVFSDTSGGISDN